MAKNEILKKAKDAKKDEFYTQLTDIEKEMMYYTEFFKDKVVFCNCDDPYESNFFKYFAMNFNHLGLKKLITTCYAGSPIITEQLSLFDVKGLIIKEENRKTPYKIEINEVNDYNHDGSINLYDVEYLIKNKKNTLTLLKGDGDFRSDECVELLKQSDIVVTNPPFSLFNEYMAQLIKYEKKFLIIGNMNALHYKEIFPLVQENKLWIGVSMNSSNRYFRVPDSYELTEKTGKIIDGKKYAFVKGCLWFTNLDNKNRHEKIVLFKKYTPEEYPKYENYNAIDVGEVSKIPVDYYGLMGVPDSFLRKYNPEQFKIIGYGRGDFIPEIGFVPKSFLDDYRKNGGRGHITSGMKTLCYYNSDGYPVFPFSRIIIQRNDSNEGEVYEDKVA